MGLVEQGTRVDGTGAITLDLGLYVKHGAKATIIHHYYIH